MVLFSIKGENLEKINPIDFKLEKDLQYLTEKNLEKIFNLEFISSEFQLDNLRIDTLAFDRETNSFVLIEYKKNRFSGLIEQGFAYLALLLNNKADFIIEYYDSKEHFLKKDEVDWTQSKVIFIAPRFTEHQNKSIEFKDMPFELWQVNLYKNDTISFTQIEASTARDSIKTIRSTSEEMKIVTREVKTYKEEDHLDNAPEEIKELYNDIKDIIFNWSGNIDIKPTKLYIAFLTNSNFIYTFLGKSQIKIVLNLKVGELDDPDHIARDISQIGHQGYGDYRIVIKPGEDLDDYLRLIKQAFKKNSQL